MTWPVWLSAPESFAIGAFIGWTLAMLAIIWLLDRGKAQL